MNKKTFTLCALVFMITVIFFNQNSKKTSKTLNPRKALLLSDQNKKLLGSKKNKANFNTTQIASFINDMDEESKQEAKEYILNIEALIHAIKYSQFEARQEWLNKWPEPKSIFEELILLTLSTEHISHSHESFDDHLDKTGQLLTLFPESKISDYLIKINSAALKSQDLMVRSQIQKYNSKYAMDSKLTKEFFKDLSHINNKNSILDRKTIKSYFEALMASQDIDYQQKYIHGINVIYRAPAEDGLKMLEVFKSKVDPFILTNQ